ncbi:hypothetical protein BJX61DRAFT_543590 [Aspergillus egyptiacus]|nr:hypothetical protein BJX61DRAFT_543590 [Aspergillus egyptiacus]
MPSSMSSLRFIAAFAVLAQSLPTAPTTSTPTAEDLASAISNDPASASTSGIDLPDLESSFMGLAGSAEIDFGKPGELPEASSDFLLGSLQNFNNDDKRGDDEEGSGPDIPDLESSFMGLAHSGELDLGSLEELPEASSDFLLGSYQGFNDGDDSGEDSDDDSDDESDDESDDDKKASN